MSMITEQVERLRNLSEKLLHADLFYVKTMLKQAADTIEQLAAKVRAENGGEWIPTAERLPEIGENVLICDIVGDIYLAHRYEYKSNTRFIDYTGDKIKDVKAWMPLPESYKEGSDADSD